MGDPNMRCSMCHNDVIDGVVPITNSFTQPELATCKNCYASLLRSIKPVIIMEDNTDTIYKIFMEGVQRDQLHRRTT